MFMFMFRLFVYLASTMAEAAKGIAFSFCHSGGYFFILLAALGLFQRHGMDHTAFQQLQP